MYRIVYMSTKKLLLVMSQELHDALEAKAVGNKSEYIRRLIEASVGLEAKAKKKQAKK